MALPGEIRIRPLGARGSSPAAGALQIRPLDDFLTSLVTGAFGGRSGNDTDMTPPQGPGEPFRDVVGGGNGEGSIGASLGFGLNGADTTAGVSHSFGHLSGRGPLSQALSPTIAIPSLSPTPAGLLGTLGQIGPNPFGFILGPLAELMQQITFNEAMRLELENTGLRESMAPRVSGPDPDTGGGNPGVPGVGPSATAAAMSVVDGIVSEGLGLTGPQSDVGLSVGTGPGVGGGDGASGGPGGSAGAPSGGGDAGNPGDFHKGGLAKKGPPKGPELRAQLLEGEFVVNKQATKAHRPLLEAINRGESPKKLRKLIDYLEAE